MRKTDHLYFAMSQLLNKSLPEKFISIVIIEDNLYLRSAWQAVLEDVDDFLLLDSYDSCEAALEAESIDHADVLLLDIGLPGMSGIEGISRMSLRNPNLLIIMITIHDDDQHVFDAICAGAVGYLLKSTSPDELILAIRQALSGGSPMTPNIARKVIASFQSPREPRAAAEVRLNDQQQEVLSRLAEGKSYAKIAEELSLSVHGVRYHLRNIYEMLHVKNRSEAVAKGLKHRLIRPPK